MSLAQRPRYIASGMCHLHLLPGSDSARQVDDGIPAIVRAQVPPKYR